MLDGHSELLVHSALQLGGEPWYPFKQVQDGESLTTRHSELDPQGDGSHGLTADGGIVASEEKKTSFLRTSYRT